MNPINWRHGLGALLICIGVSACDQQTTGREEAQAPTAVPEATTTAPVDTGTAQTDPYATTPPIDESGTMTGSAEDSATQTTGDTLGDRCAGFTGEALTECLKMEGARRQDVQDPTMQDPTQTPAPDVPQQ